MSWLKKGKLEGPTEIKHLPVIYGNIYEYDLNRLKKGDTIKWVVVLTLEKNGVATEEKLRFEVEVK